jgi:hypothetical protein
MNNDAASKTAFKFLDAKLLVNRIRPNPAQLIAHNTALSEGCLARHITRVELKTFTSPCGTQSLSIHNAVIGPVPKRILITILKNKEFLGSLDSNPYNSGITNSNFAITSTSNIPNEGLSTDFGHEKRSVMAYRTIFKCSGIHHSNVSNQITHDMFINGYFMLLFDLTPDQAASEGNYHLRPTVTYVWTLNSPKLYLKLLIISCFWSMRV